MFQGYWLAPASGVRRASLAAPGSSQRRHSAADAAPVASAVPSTLPALSRLYGHSSVTACALRRSAFAGLPFLPRNLLSQLTRWTVTSASNALCATAISTTRCMSRVSGYNQHILACIMLLTVVTGACAGVASSLLVLSAQLPIVPILSPYRARRALETSGSPSELPAQPPRDTLSSSVSRAAWRCLCCVEVGVCLKDVAA